MIDLQFNDSFPNILKKVAENVLETPVEVGERFNSADSFSYLLTSASEKYVGKIFKFAYWPPSGKLEYVHMLLDSQALPHEEILHSSYDHPTFIHGWQLSKFIEGGTVNSLRDSKLWNQEEYCIKLGKLLRKIHTVKLGYFGALHDRKERFETFQQFAQFELAELDLSVMSSDYPTDMQIITQAKKGVLRNLDSFDWTTSTLIHNDANDHNVMWQNGNPLLIDWVDSLAGPPVRDFATLTFRQDKPVLQMIEKGYGSQIDLRELRLHQIMRFIRLARFYSLEGKNLIELQTMMKRLQKLLTHEKPYGM